MKKKCACEPFELRFERDGGRCLVSGPAGALLRLTPSEFSAFRSGRVKEGTPLFNRLAEAGLLRGRLDFDALTAGLAGLSSEVSAGPGLHILVLTLKCNHACVYCRAVGGHGGDSMSRATALAAVETAFRSPNPAITIEFQGGEALLNWPVLKAAAAYAKRLNRKAGKDLALSVVTNLSLMDEEKFSWLVREGVSVCTSLDGPADLHDVNRRWSGGSSHAAAVRWLKRFMAAAARDGRRDTLPSALMTTTRQSLGRAADIVEEYRALGLGGVFLRPLSPIGYAAAAWPEIGYAPEAFLAFYREALDRVMKINFSGERFVERWAAILSAKLLRREDPGYLDLRSPCGAAIGQLAYNWDGDVYTCDEGRMLAACGDPFFRLGNVRRNSYEELLSAPAARVCAMASCLESQPACARCAFKLFCGVCPVHNYAEQGSPWGAIPGGTWCALHKGLFKIVFGLLENKKSRRVIESWLDGKR
ncbi:MAG: putative arylsulfatase regulator [Elusimicrobia bacterium]|nr:MAG: putative arylsulfatase regulator [Elusimicrobiota bacterium]KAF0157964.1 MAG: putative arylsulfatase regulator [Elusimicrobiota bacterium]